MHTLEKTLAATITSARAHGVQAVSIDELSAILEVHGADRLCQLARAELAGSGAARTDALAQRIGSDPVKLWRALSASKAFAVEPPLMTPAEAERWGMGRASRSVVLRARWHLVH